jgi:UrcA family protein
MKRFLSARLLALAAACAASAILITAAARAQAPDPDGVETRVVSTRGLDLSQSDDRMRLQRRVDAAVGQLCGEPSPIELDRWMARDALVQRDTEYAAARAAARRAG